METFSVTELMNVLATAAGTDETVDLTGDVADTDFEQLGYESLAILEAAGAIERTYGVALDEEELFEAQTPNAVVELVNRTLREQAA